MAIHPACRRERQGAGRVAPAAALVTGVCLTAACLAAPVQEAQRYPLPLPGETFQVQGRTAFLIMPEGATRGKRTPWVWYAPTLPGLPGTEERWMFERFTDAGIAIAGIDVGESYGNPEGRRLFTALYNELVRKRGMSAKPIMLGRSRGGLMTLNWAAENARKVGGFAGIYPVCDLANWPGLAIASPAYGMTPDELAARLEEHNPVERLAPLAQAKVPLFAIHGDLDGITIEANSGGTQRRYAALGGKMELVVARGQGHSMWEGYFRCQELVDFVLRHAPGRKPAASRGRLGPAGPDAAAGAP